MQEAHEAPVIRASASVLMVRDAPVGLEVFMIRRNDRLDAHGGSYVFPGGKVDAADAAASALAQIDASLPVLRANLHEEELDDAAAAALYVAAAREAYEECGVLFARAKQADAADAASEAAEAEAFAPMLARRGLSLDVAALFPWSRWITPVNSVSSPGRRFDTRFFVAALPAGQQPRHDNHEAIDSEWMTPRSALERYWDGQIAMAPPQIMTLAHLGRYASAQALLADAAQRKPYLVRPEVLEGEGGRTLAYPGDPMHSERERVMPGPLRLFVRGRRMEPAEGFNGFWI